MSWNSGSQETTAVSDGTTPDSRTKKSPMICAKLAKTLSFETATPAGARVDPEVYCRYNVLDPSSPAPRAPGLDDRGRESRSSKSISRIDGAFCPGCGCADSLTSPMTADVVRRT